MYAASMSYFTMMAIVPFCLFVITLFGYFLGHYPEFYNFFLRRLVSFFPEVTNEIMQDISKLISFKGIGKVGLVLYGLLSYQVFASYEAALNAIFKVKKKRRFIFSVLISLSVVTLIIALLMLSFAATSIVPLLKALSPFLPGLKIGKITQFIIRFVVPFVLVLLVVTMLYILIPKTRVSFFNSFRGAMFTTIFLEDCKAYIYLVCQLSSRTGQDLWPLNSDYQFPVMGLLFLKYFFNRR